MSRALLNAMHRMCTACAQRVHQFGCVWIGCCATLGVLVWASAAGAQEVARYQVTIDFAWDAQGDPADPHWSRLIALSHTAKYRLFQDGDTASSGLALVATNGRVSVLEAELAEARRRGRVDQELVLPGIEGVGRFSFQIELTQRHHYVSFATMLAPSPDWFSGASGVNLRQGDEWVAEHQEPLWVWDAGVDSGAMFTAPNAPTQPHQSVRLATHPSFLRSDGLHPIGEARFTLLPD